jgi:Ankyrin repeats (3 copies)
MPVTLKKIDSTVNLSAADDNVRATLELACGALLDAPKFTDASADDLDVLTEVLRAKLGVGWVCLTTVMDDAAAAAAAAAAARTVSFQATASAPDLELDFEQLLPDYSFGARTMATKDLLLVPDTLKDDQLRDCVLVTEAPHFRFYAGCPLVTVQDGRTIGSLCVLDKKPNILTAAQQDEIKETAQTILAVLSKTPDAPYGMRKRDSCSDLTFMAAATVPTTESTAGFDNPTQQLHQEEPSLLPQSETMEQSSGKRSRSNSLARRCSQSEASSRTIPSLSVPLILPSPNMGNNLSPDEFLAQLVTGLYPTIQLGSKPALELDGYFTVVTEGQMACYTMEIVTAARTNNLVALKAIHKRQGPNALACFNRFGEGLLNMACRRGFTDMVEYFLSPEVNLAVRVRDDYGRTPLHDACWSPEPQLQICTWIVEKDPSLFLVADKRGFTPFQYARECDWPIWRQFLADNLDYLRSLASPEIVARFS